ncbi:hypothetical protein EYF80_014554 [Liparis tanakae]|uniref:Uncharacterized protein n=1 Tax=Liparis tanakae TaxID=230148 RepID=A0A4Z2ICP8_9TELE|nr:hypothetical protein EYF80_014554 [Liparis tanakae]
MVTDLMQVGQAGAGAGARSQEPGARSQEPGARSQEPGARSQEPGAVLRRRDVVELKLGGHRGTTTP